MCALRAKTYIPKVAEADKKWHLVDASDQVLGRMASRVAAVLRGKHRPEFTPHLDLGDHIVIVNAEKIHLTGGKLLAKNYYRHSGYPGGMRAIRYDRMMSETPEKAVYLAVRRMLPRNRLGRKLIKKLRVYRGSEHPHEAQNPVPLDLDTIR